MSNLVVVDSGPLVALWSPSEAHHQWAKARFAEFRPPLLTCEPVLTESMHLLRNHPKGLAALKAFWRRGILKLGFSGQDQCTAILGLMERYVDLPMSLADACLVRMSELNPDCVIWTLDSHFKAYRRHGRQVIPCVLPGD